MFDILILDFKLLVHAVQVHAACISQFGIDTLLEGKTYCHIQTGLTSVVVVGSTTPGGGKHLFFINSGQ